MMLESSLARVLYYGAIGLFISVSAQAQDARVVMQTTDKTITVLQASSWPRCEKKVRFAVATKKKSVFEGNKVRLQKIIGGLRAITSGTCSKMSSIEITGFYKGKPVYKAVVRKSEGWRLIPVKPTAQDNTDTAYDNKRFLDLLSRSSGAPTSPTTSQSNQTQRPTTTIQPPPSASADKVTSGENWRDQHAYKKLTRNIEQTLGLSADAIIERCNKAQSEPLSLDSPATQDLIYRICRAIYYSNGNIDLGKNSDRKILQDR